MSGIIAFSLGSPVGISKKAVSFLGLFNISPKKFIGLGVCVRVASPEW